MDTRKLLRHTATTAASVGGGALLGTAAGAAIFARKVLTPDPRRPDDVEIIDVRANKVTLARNAETEVDGYYGLWLDGGAGHARIGRITGLTATEVQRDVVAVDSGALSPGPARWNAYYYGDTPTRSLGIPHTDLTLTSEVGELPAWLIPAAEDEVSDTWAVLVHGRGARREETLRVVPTLHRAGITCLIPSYRNDLDAPPGPDGRYNLGLSEWRDIEAAMAYALEHGAERLILVGWSMGGAITLQALSRSRYADRVLGAVLDGPVVDWADVLRHHALLHRTPGWLAEVATGAMSRHWLRHVVGVATPVDVAQTNWVARASELRHPLLVIHSIDDEFVPAKQSQALAATRPELVTMPKWRTARHCKEWNLDPSRWEGSVATFVRSLTA